MISEAIVVGLVAGISSIISSWLVNKKSQHIDDIERAKRQQIIDSKLEVIEEKLDEHNHYAKRFEEIEKAIIRINTILEEFMKKG